jgi:sterol 14-demethylase
MLSSNKVGALSFGIYIFLLLEFTSAKENPSSFPASSVAQNLRNHLVSLYIKPSGQLNYISLVVTVLALVLVLKKIFQPHVKGKRPPIYPYRIPWFGNALEFATNPGRLMQDGYKRFGEIFRILIFGQDIYLMVGPEAHKAFYEAPEDILCARKAYEFTVPVFGRKIVYDADHETFQQQRRFISGGLTTKRFRMYVDMIVQELEQYTAEHWGQQGTCCMMEFFSVLLVATAARCLQGPEIRSHLNAGPFSKLMADLDRALAAFSYFFPYLPTPVNRRRDRARQEIVKIFSNIMHHRLETGARGEDLLQVFMESKYTNGQGLTEDEIAGLCIAVMLAGQHTSNVTSAWFGCHILTRPHIKQKLLEEQRLVLRPGVPFDFEALKQMTYLANCLKETLRLNPPIIIVERKAEVDWSYKGFVIPKGSLVAVSPLLANRLPEIYSNPDEFDPDRYERREDKSKPYSYLSFSAGRHACIGEQFAHLQIKTVWSHLLRHWDLSLVDGKMPQPDYTSLIVAPVTPVTIRYKRILPESPSQVVQTPQTIPTEAN